MQEDYKTKFQGLYLQTAKEYVEKLKADLKTLQSDFSDTEALNSAYISAHSLKSQSLVMTYHGIGEASGILEFTFRDLKDTKMQVSKNLLELLEHAVLTLSFALQSIEDGSGEPDLTSLVRELESGTGLHFAIK